jgi:hypothetical protein
MSFELITSYPFVIRGEYCQIKVQEMKFSIIACSSDFVTLSAARKFKYITRYCV